MLSSIYFSQAILVGIFLVSVVIFAFIRGKSSKWSELILYYILLFIALIGFMIVDSMFPGLQPKISINIALSSNPEAGPAWVKTIESLSSALIGVAFSALSFTTLRAALRNESDRLRDALRVLASAIASCQVITDGMPSLATLMQNATGWSIFQDSRGIIGGLLLIFLVAMFLACTVQSSQKKGRDVF